MPQGTMGDVVQAPPLGQVPGKGAAFSLSSLYSFSQSQINIAAHKIAGMCVPWDVGY